MRAFNTVLVFLLTLSLTEFAGAQKKSHMPDAKTPAQLGANVSCLSMLKDHCANNQRAEGLYSRRVKMHLEQRLARKEKLPADLRAKLESEGYFAQVSEFLAKTSEAGTENIAEAEVMTIRLSAAWNAAFEATVDSRMPSAEGVKAENELTESASEENRLEIVKNLNSEIIGAMWKNTAIFRDAEKQFSEMSASVTESLKASKNLSPETKKLWIAKIRSLRLQLPNLDEASACGSLGRQVFYDLDSNSFTVCIGTMNEHSDLRALMARELAQVINSSGAIHHESGFQEEVCGPKAATNSSALTLAVGGRFYADWLKKNHPKNLENRRKNAWAGMESFCADAPASAAFFNQYLRDTLACTRVEKGEDCTL